MVSQTNIYLAFTLSLLCLSPMEVASATDAVPVRMNPMDFNEISLRESSSELSSIPAAKRSRMWRSKARQYFKAGNCVDKTQPCSLPYVFCDTTQGLSSNKRRDRLTDELLNRTPDNEIDLVEIDLLPFFFDEEQSCYTASMTPKIARKLANKSCESDEKTCIIHPLLPMMKLSQGTVESVTQSAELKVDQQISIYAGLSPYHTLSRDEISLQSLATEVIESGLEPENCENQLGDALPSTGTSLSCESQHSLNAAQIEVDWKHSTALFTIIPEDGDSPEILRQKVLRFMSGLASRSEFTSVQDATDSYYFD